MKIRKPSECKWDAVSLGEIMIRLDPGDGRVRNARQFNVWEGGGEYNVTRALRRCFGLRTAVVTGFVRNEVGYLLEDLILQGGVDMSHAKWFDYDGIGEDVRIGLNFTERGHGVRAAKGTSDRARSAASRLSPEDVDWEKLFGEEGARWFHTGGIYAALSESTPEVLEAAMKAAKKHGTLISYDLNYRASLWKRQGGQTRAREVNRALAKYVDVMIGNEEDFTAALGFEVEGVTDDVTNIQVESFKRMIDRVVKEFPNFQAVATTLREVKSATFNDWGAILYTDGNYYEATNRENLEIFDRVGGGDSFASGLIFGFLDGRSPQEAVELGAAHGALAMTTPGDTSMVSLSEVEKLAGGGSARVER